MNFGLQPLYLNKRQNKRQNSFDKNLVKILGEALPNSFKSEENPRNQGTLAALRCPLSYRRERPEYLMFIKIL
jgi:hypothetical protein